MSTPTKNTWGRRGQICCRGNVQEEDVLCIDPDLIITLGGITLIILAMDNVPPKVEDILCGPDECAGAEESVRGGARRSKDGMCAVSLQNGVGNVFCKDERVIGECRCVLLIKIRYRAHGDRVECVHEADDAIGWTRPAEFEQTELLVREVVPRLPPPQNNQFITPFF